MALISVIVPVYNTEKYLDECIESICAQTLKDIEVILVNDGSTDSSEDICRKWVEKDPRISVYSKENGGVSSARNTGLGHSSGKYVMFIDSDDIAAPDCCEKLLEKMTDDVDLVVLGIARLLQNKEIRYVRKAVETGIYESAELRKTVIDDGSMTGFTFRAVSACLYRQDVIRNNGISFNENIRFNEDGLFNVDYVMRCTGRINVDYGLVVNYYRLNTNSLSTTVDRVSDSYFATLDYINSVLSGLTETVGDFDIPAQICRRYVTNGLSQLKFASVNRLDLKIFKRILKSGQFREGLRYIDRRRLPAKKKLVLALLKTGNPFLVRSGLRFAWKTVGF